MRQSCVKQSPTWGLSILKNDGKCCMNYVLARPNHRPRMRLFHGDPLPYHMMALSWTGRRRLKSKLGLMIIMMPRAITPPQPTIVVQRAWDRASKPLPTDQQPPKASHLRSSATMIRKQSPRSYSMNRLKSLR